jgi:hypothetical protein
VNSQAAWAKLLKDRVLRDNRPITYHIYSSLWSSIKEEFSTTMNNSIWLLGSGENINFWNDNWCGNSLSELFNIPRHISQSLSSKVSDFISNGHWRIPSQLSQAFPTLTNLI